MIEFRKDTEVAKFYDPSDKEIKESEIEVRTDPLTGKTSRILDKPLGQTGEEDMSDVEKDGFCPFCSENLKKVGARDVRLLSGEMWERGEAALLGNVTPYSEYSIIIRLTEEHYLSLEEFEEKHFADGFKLILEYLENIEDMEENKFPAVIMNYLKPAGSSVVHPHMQLLVSGKKMNYQRSLISRAKEYFEKEENCYWNDLLNKERNGERFIGKAGETEWISAFAPRGFNHLKGINTETFLDFKDKDISDLSKGVTKVLKAYSEMECNSFNFSIFIPAFSEKQKFATIVDMITRTNLDKFYRADDFAMPKLLDEPYCNKNPEELAEEIKGYW